MNIVCLISTLLGAINFNSNEAKLAPHLLNERLSFKLEYLNLTVARLNFEMVATQGDNYHLKVHAKSTGSANLMFKLDNLYETYFDQRTFLPNRIVKRIDQKNIQHQLNFSFDHRNGSAKLGDSLSWQIPDDCFDYFSMLYFLRSQRLQPGDLLSFHLDSEYIISRVEVKVVSNQESIKVPAGRFKAIKLNLKFTQLTQRSRPWRTDLLTNRLAAPGSELTLWLSDDADLLPLKISYHQSQIKTQLVLDSFSRGQRR